MAQALRNRRRITSATALACATVLLSLGVAQAQTATTTTLTSSGLSQCGETVIFVTVVSPVPPATGAPTGTVTYTDLTTGQTLDTVGLTTAEGVQQNAFVTSTLTPGNHTIQASY